jgi:hypothetical protein
VLRLDPRLAAAKPGAAAALFQDVEDVLHRASLVTQG